jgi:hypothetical protein
MPSRREPLTALATSAAVGLAGCAGAGSSRGEHRRCHTSYGDRTTGDLFDVTGPGVDPEEGNVILLVAFPRADIAEFGVRRVQFRHSDGTVAHELPVSPGGGQPAPTGKYPAEDVREFRTSLGSLPQAGWFRVVALDAGGDEIDAVTVSFECYVEEGDD